jgi:hypothetical protein
MRHREQILKLLTQLGRDLGFEVQINAPASRQKFQEPALSAAEVEWLLSLSGHVNVEPIRRFIPDFTEHLPIAGFVLSDEKDREPLQFYQLAMLSAQRYPFGFLVTDGAAAYRRANRSLRTFRHLLGAGQCLVADGQQLDAVLARLQSVPENQFNEIREPRFVEEMGEPAARKRISSGASKTWTTQAKILLRAKGHEAGLAVSENVGPIDFAHDFENRRQEFATVQGYLQTVLLEEIGHALGFYHSFTPLDNRPPKPTTSWKKQFATATVDMIWRLPLPVDLRQFFDHLYDLDFALRFGVPLLQSAAHSLPLVGFLIERSIVPKTAARLLMLSRGCRFGVVITPQSQLVAAQKLFEMLSRATGLANVSALARQEVLDNQK